MNKGKGYEILSGNWENPSFLWSHPSNTFETLMLAHVGAEGRQGP